MKTRSFLLGGAIAFALSSAAFAQTTNDATPSNKTEQHKIVHHYRHHARNRVMHTASMVAPASKAEQDSTYSLNREQLQTAGYTPERQSGQNAVTGDALRSGPELTPMRRIPVGAGFQSATPAGGRADTPSLSQNHRQ
jgi:hypothetical protein